MTTFVTMKSTTRVPTSVRASEFKAKCLELMDRVAATGQSVVVTKRGVPIARLAPLVERPATLRGFLGRRVEIVGNIVGPIVEDWHAAR